METIVKFKQWNCNVVFLHYHNGRTAIQLTDSVTHEPIAMASVNVDTKLEDDEICIKDYSENEGMLSAMVNHGIVSEPIRFVQSGFVTIPVCTLLTKN